MSKQQGSLLSATGAAPTSLARKCYEILGFTVRATDTRKPLLRIPALEELVNCRTYYGTPVAVAFLILLRIYLLELIEMVSHYLEKR